VGVPVLKFQPVLTCILKEAKAITSVFRMARKPAIEKKGGQKYEEDHYEMVGYFYSIVTAVCLYGRGRGVLRS
jgi:hypothetical protein